VNLQLITKYNGFVGNESTLVNICLRHGLEGVLV